MTAFLFCGAIIAAILFLASFWLSLLENKDRNGGLIESHRRYTIWGVLSETMKEKISGVKKRICKRNKKEKQ